MKRSEYPHVFIPNRSLALNLSFKDEQSEEKENLRKQVEEYNSYLDKLDAIPGFLDFFKKNSLCVSRESVAEHWSEETAESVFDEKSYIFTTDLKIVNDYLFDCNFFGPYQAIIDDAAISIPVGEYAYNYPGRINDKKAIWNWVDNGHDFCFFLWELLGGRSRQNEDSDEEDDAGIHYYFDEYNLIRDDDIEPQLANVFTHLQNCGYIRAYTIRPETGDPRWIEYGKSDGSIDLALVDMSFLNDETVMEQVEYLLWEPLDEEDAEINTECDSEKEDGSVIDDNA